MLALTQTTPGPDNLSVSNQSYHAFLHFGTSKFFKTKKIIRAKWWDCFCLFQIWIKMQEEMEKRSYRSGAAQFKKPWVGESQNMAERIWKFENVIWKILKRFKSGRPSLLLTKSGPARSSSRQWMLKQWQRLFCTFFTIWYTTCMNILDGNCHGKKGCIYSSSSQAKQERQECVYILSSINCFPWSL